MDELSALYQDLADHVVDLEPFHPLADPGRAVAHHILQVLTPGARAQTPPSLAGGRIFARNLEEIVGIDVR